MNKYLILLLLSFTGCGYRPGQCYTKNELNPVYAKITGVEQIDGGTKINYSYVDLIYLEIGEQSRIDDKTNYENFQEYYPKQIDCNVFIRKFDFVRTYNDLKNIKDKLNQYQTDIDYLYSEVRKKKK